MTFDPGRVRLSLQIEDDRVATVAVACERPAVAGLLRGKSAEQAVALVPLIYSLCGKAQGVAARVALSAARGNAVEPYVDAEVWAEAAREHAWKIFVDWPRQLGMVADEAFFVCLVRATAGGRDELAGQLAAHPLPAGLREAAGSGEIAELFAGRMAVRLQELRDWLTGHPGTPGQVRAEGIAPGTAEACVETARGTLIHRLALDGDRIGDYAIRAPTDMHFSVSGDATAWLDKLRGLERTVAERQARLLTLAFDPCVPWELT